MGRSTPPLLHKGYSVTAPGLTLRAMLIRECLASVELIDPLDAGGYLTDLRLRRTLRRSADRLVADLDVPIIGYTMPHQQRHRAPDDWIYLSLARVGHLRVQDRYAIERWTNNPRRLAMGFVSDASPLEVSLAARDQRRRRAAQHRHRYLRSTTAPAAQCSGGRGVYALVLHHPPRASRRVVSRPERPSVSPSRSIGCGRSSISNID